MKPYFVSPYISKLLYTATLFELVSTADFVSSILTVIASHDAQCPLPSF